MSDPFYPSYTGTERELLDAWLDFERDAIFRKVEGASDMALREPKVPSGVSLLSIVKHLGWVERWWFQVCFAAEGEPAFPDDGPDEDSTFRIEPDDTVSSVKDFYRQMIARSREIAATASLEDISRRPGNDFSFRWILIHMIEETARHAGHADIIREQVDGVTGM